MVLLTKSTVTSRSRWVARAREGVETEEGSTVLAARAALAAAEEDMTVVEEDGVEEEAEAERERVRREGELCLFVVLS